MSKAFVNRAVVYVCFSLLPSNFAGAAVSDTPTATHEARPAEVGEAGPTDAAVDVLLERLRTGADAFASSARYAEAMTVLEAILSRTPDDATALDARGLARWRSLESRADPFGAGGGFAVLQRERCREGQIDCDEVALALADLGRSIALQSGPERAAPLVDRAGIYAARGDTQRALTDYDEAVRLRPADPTSRIRRAEIRQRSGDVIGAEADLDEALLIRPHDGQALLERARLRQHRGNLDGARADLDDALHHQTTGTRLEWIDQARDLRRSIARPGEPGSETEIVGLKVRKAFPTRQVGEIAVAVRLDDDGARSFADFTTWHTGSVVQVLIEGDIVAEPRILSPIVGGLLILSGNFTADTAAALAAKLGSGVTLTVRVEDR